MIILLKENSSITSKSDCRILDQENEYEPVRNISLFLLAPLRLDLELVHHR
jgi:hypothetical protein